MSQIIASLAARVASTADFVARTAAPVDAHGATPSAFTSLSSSRALFTEDGPGGAIYRLPPLLKRSAQDVQNAATMGPAFRLEDLVRVFSLLAFFINSLLASYLRIVSAVLCSIRERRTKWEAERCSAREKATFDMRATRLEVACNCIAHT